MGEYRCFGKPLQGFLFMIETLQLRDEAKNQLAKIKDIESGVNYLNKVKAIEIWAKAEKKDAELQTLIAEQKIRTQRILGKLIQDGQKNGEVASQGENRYSMQEHLQPAKKLSDIGITAKQSMAYKQIANIPERKFEQIIAEKKQAVQDSVAELTTAGILKIAKEVEYERKKDLAELTERDKELISALKRGETIVVNQKTDLATIKYAESKNLYVRCDRSSEWGNPFELDKDGDRDQVCDNFKEHYLPYKPSLLSRIHELKGKALGCWCAPLKCHCDTLKRKAK